MTVRLNLPGNRVGFIDEQDLYLLEIYGRSIHPNRNTCYVRLYGRKGQVPPPSSSSSPRHT